MSMKKKSKLTFDKKMIRFITRALVVSTAMILLVSAVSTIISLIRKSTQMALGEVDAIVANTEDSFKRYYDLIWSINLNEHVQSYLKGGENQQASVLSTLADICNMDGNINFIWIQKEDNNDSLIKGNLTPNWIANYQVRLNEDYENSILMGYDAVRVVYTKDYNRKGEYALSIYYLIYSNTKIGEKLGLLCVNVNNASFQLMQDHNADMGFIVNNYFVHENGDILSSAKEEDIGTKMAEIDSFCSKEGQISGKTGMIIYKKVSGWDFYYVARIGWWDLAKDSVRTIMILLLLLLCIIFIIIRMARRMVEKAYEPWGNVVYAMEKVSAGELETRLDVKEEDPDMKVVSTGFNSMMQQLIRLMEQIKEEQYQMNQIRLNALHSQIQPHFLYNTLDCIHWQAVMSGNQDISNMVKALASYYRTCLSKGKDIITLQQEVEYIRNYLFIQRMRYGDVLNYEISSEPGLEKALIPKLTLQPLVENAIYHGIKSSEDKEGHIFIRIFDASPDVEILIEDDGVGMSDEKLEEMNKMISIFDEQYGYGVRNVNRRIQLFCGEEYGLHYQKNEKGGITVRVLLPYTITE
ncbi:MAG: sensor histidine kinase [Lachnospiraceae bacterium]